MAEAQTAMKRKTIAAFLGLLIALSAAFSCNRNEGPEYFGTDKHRRVSIAYVDWSTEVAGTNLVKAVLQADMGYHCEIEAMRADEMWEAVAEGRVDATVSAWLPKTHEHYYRQYKDRVTNLGPNLEDVRTGLVVPRVTVGRKTGPSGKRNEPYITIESIPELADKAGKFRHRIVGIDPDAGIMKKTRQAIEAYGLADEFRLVEGSESAMIEELTEAIRKQKYIVITGWSPHWMFARWKLDFLKDPENVYGRSERICTIVRPGLKDDMPEVYEFLDNFYWNPADMAQLMLWNREDRGLDPYEKALRWMRTHDERVKEWLPEKG